MKSLKVVWDDAADVMSSEVGTRTVPESWPLWERDTPDESRRGGKEESRDGMG